MGKLKKHSRNSRARRLQQNLQKLDSNTDDTIRTNRVLPLIQKLSSSSPNDRSMAIGAISVLCEDSTVRKLMLKEKLVNIVMEQCLNDNNDEIVVESFGLLRNLVIEEGYDVAKFLMRSKIWVSIEANLEKVEKAFKYMTENSGSVKKEEKVILFDHAENLIGLVTGLATVDGELFDEIYPKIGPVVNVVSEILNWNLQNNSLKISMRLFAVLLDFIYQFCNQSMEFIEQVSQVISWEKLLKFNNETNLSNLCQIYIQALRFHFCEFQGVSNNDEFVLQSLQDILLTITKIDISQALKKTLENELTDNKALTQDALIARNDLESVDVALDLIATLIEFNASDHVNDELIQYYLTNLVPLLIELLSFKDQSFLNKSLICLNNLSWLFFELPIKPVLWFESLQKVWQILFNDFMSLQNTDDIELMTDYLKLLWVIAKSLDQTLHGQISVEQINIILTKSNTVIDIIKEPELLQNYFISLIQFLASIASIQSQLEITSLISEHLFNLINNSINIINTDTDNTEIKALKLAYLFQMIITESIAVMFEIFSDKEFNYDTIYVGNNYNGKLRHLETELRPVFKKVDKNKNPQLREQLLNVLDTLNRFIEYKENEL